MVFALVKAQTANQFAFSKPRLPTLIRACRLWQQAQITPTRRGWPEGHETERVESRIDTIPKPVGLGTLLQDHDTNSYRTGSNAIRECSTVV